MTKERQRGHEVSAFAREASRISAQLEGALERARQEVERALLRLDGLARSLDPTDEQARRIGDVAKTSGESATRTDLLALNFQVEAARLGEEDRGLERVAYEIRTLADRGARGSVEIDELATQLLRSSADIREAYEASKTNLKAALDGLSDALRRGAKVGEAISRATTAADELAAGPALNGSEGLEAAVSELASAAEVREDTIRRVAEVSAARLWRMLVDLRLEGGRAEASAELLGQFDERLRELFGIVADADEIARRAKQLALNADLAANNSEDPAFSLFAEEARRLSEQAELTASATQAQLTETRALIAPELVDRADRARTLNRLTSELERVLRGFGATGQKVADQAQLEQVWREDQASARNLAQARASYRALEAEPEEE